MQLSASYLKKIQFISVSYHNLERALFIFSSNVFFCWKIFIFWGWSCIFRNNLSNFTYHVIFSSPKNLLTSLSVTSHITWFHSFFWAMTCLILSLSNCILEIWKDWKIRLKGVLWGNMERLWLFEYKFFFSVWNSFFSHRVFIGPLIVFSSVDRFIWWFWPFRWGWLMWWWYHLWWSMSHLIWCQHSALS